jgi:hypothetical protein
VTETRWDFSREKAQKAQKLLNPFVLFAPFCGYLGVAKHDCYEVREALNDFCGANAAPCLFYPPLSAKFFVPAQSPDVSADTLL